MTVTVLTLTNAKFPLGDVVVTANAHAQLDHQAVREAITRHASGDWGEVPEADRKENELSLKTRLPADFRLPGQRQEILDHHGSRPFEHNRLDAGGLLEDGQGLCPCFPLPNGWAKPSAYAGCGKSDTGETAAPFHNYALSEL